MNPSSCPYCGATHPANAQRCSDCGATLEGNPQLRAGTRVGAYTLNRVLGQGGFGITYLSADSSVAIKEFFPDGLVTRAANGHVNPKVGQEAEFRRLLERFAREATVLWKLEHPSATKYLGFWQENGTAYFAMEYLEGETLEARIARGQKLSETEARRAMLEILDLLEVVHAQGLLHRDIKPANIVLTAQRAELIDFGSVTDFNRRGVTSRLLTPEYAPLELYGQDVQLSPASDLYSLCATFYEAVTLTKPPSAIERMNGSRVIVVSQLEPFVSSEFAKALEKGLALKVEQRWRSSRPLHQVIQPRAQTATRALKDEPLVFKILAGFIFCGLASLIFSYANLVTKPVFETNAALQAAERECSTFITAQMNLRCLLRYSSKSNTVNFKLYNTKLPPHALFCIPVTQRKPSSVLVEHQRLTQSRGFVSLIGNLSISMFESTLDLAEAYFYVHLCGEQVSPQVIVYVDRSIAVRLKKAQTDLERQRTLTYNY
jgi:serine/threonine protein kinase